MTEVDAEVFGRALLAAGTSDPPGLLDALRSELRRLPGALDLTMHLIDYRLASLRPIEFHRSPRLVRPEPVDGSAIGAAFCAEQASDERVPAGHLRHVPITVRGQRLGVLTGTFTEPPTPAAQRVLDSLALAAAHALLEMSAGTDLYETGRRHGSLSVAAELQWQLLPARAFRTSDFYVAGHLEPALRVAGDAYDFVVNDRALSVVVIDATGTHGAPSWLTTLAVTALRNARRSGLPLPEQASLASDVIWQQSAGQDHASALLLELDADKQRAAVVNAGSPALLRMRAGEPTAQEFEPQTPLGMFADTAYVEQQIDLRPGDRAYVLTDGAYALEHTLRDVIGLLGTDEHGGRQSPPESIRRLVTTLTRGGGAEPEDDITIVCLDWLS